jgi:hypothetical protein
MKNTREIEKIIKEMKNYLTIKAVRDIANNKDGRCTCADTVLKDEILCEFCEANSLIAKFDRTMKEN